MILIDTNILVAAGLHGTKFHESAQPWLDEQLQGPSRVGLPWHSLLGFVRLSSDRKLFRDGPSVDEAWQIVKTWIAAPASWIPQPTERHEEIIGDLIASASVRTKDVMDLHLAALAIEHGLTLCSVDTGFVRFKNLRWVNPLD